MMTEEDLVKISLKEKIFLGINVFMAGTGTAAGFAFPTLSVLAVLLGLTGPALAAFAITSIVIFGLLASCVAIYFFVKLMKGATTSIEKIKKAENYLEMKFDAVKRRGIFLNAQAPLNFLGVESIRNQFKDQYKIETNDSDDEEFWRSSGVLGGINIFISYGSILGPCVGVISAVTSIGIISGIAAVAPPILFGLVLTAFLSSMITAYGAYELDCLNVARHKWFAKVEDTYKLLVKVEEGSVPSYVRVPTDSFNTQSFGQVLPHYVEGVAPQDNVPLDNEAELVTLGQH